MDLLIDILVVEDDPHDLQLTIRVLQKNMAMSRIEVARDGEEALDILLCRGVHADRAAHSQPSLVLLDLKLPKINGLQVLREMKERPETRAIPVVALTSSREERDLIESYRLGVNSYIQKPVDFDKFRETIRAVSTYWLEVNQRPPKAAFPTGNAKNHT